MRFDFAKLAERAEKDRVADGGTRAITAPLAAPVAVAAGITTAEPMPAAPAAGAAAAAAAASAKTSKPAKTAKPVPAARVPAAGVPSAQLSTQDEAHRLEVLRRAQKGDTAVLPQVREILKDAPEGGLMPVARNTEAALLRAMYAEDLLAREDTERQLVALRRDLAGGAEPSPLEALLVERIALCWLWLHYHETVYAQNMVNLPGAVHVRFQDRIDRAHRRYLSALKALAQVRRLRVPLSVQVNVAAAGGQQVNVAGELPPAGSGRS